MNISSAPSTKPKINWRFITVNFFIGLAVGTIGDFVHLLTKTTDYTANSHFPFLPFLPVGMPVWVPLEFGFGIALLAIAHKLMSEYFRPRLCGKQGVAIVAPIFFLALYAATGIIQAGTGGWQDVWLAIVAILLWWTADRTALGAALAFIVSLIGTGYEIFLTTTGGYFYYPHHSNLFGVPSWLPWLYMSGSICVSLLVRQID